MLRGMAGGVVLVLTLTIALPMALDAQESASIRVGVRVVSSVIPDTRATTAALVSEFAKANVEGTSVVKRSVQTARGFAQVVSEGVAPVDDMALQSTPSAAETAGRSSVRRVLITVAYTAN